MVFISSRPVFSQFIHEIGSQKPDIEDHVCLNRQSIGKAERHEVVFIPAFVTKGVTDKGQLMGVNGYR